MGGWREGERGFFERGWGMRERESRLWRYSGRMDKWHAKRGATSSFWVGFWEHKRRIGGRNCSASIHEFTRLRDRHALRSLIGIGILLKQEYAGPVTLYQNIDANGYLESSHSHSTDFKFFTSFFL